jgi:hypothetical protein
LDIGLVVIIPAVVALLLRLTWHRVPLENNGSVFLYDAVFGTSECPAAGQSGTVAILRFFHRIFGNRWNYRWIRGVYTFFTVWATVAVTLLGNEIGGQWAGLIAGLCFAVFSNMPHFLPFFTNSERSNVALMSSAYLLCIWGIRPESIWAHGNAPLLAAAGVAAGLAVLCKVPAVFEVIPLVWFVIVSARQGAGAAGANVILPLLAGLGLMAFIGVASAVSRDGWGALIGFAKLILRYKSADHGLRENMEKRSDESLMGKGFAGIFAGTAPLWIFAAAYALWRVSGHGFNAVDSLLLLWVLCAAVGIGVQRVFSAGHWVTVLPSVCLLAGLGMSAVFAGSGPSTHDAGYFLAVITLVAGLVFAGLTSASHQWRVGNVVPFQQGLQDVAMVLKEVTRPSDTVFVWGWHPQVYVLAHRRCAAPPLYYCKTQFLDGLMPEWRKVLVMGFIKNRPRCVLFVDPGMPLQMVADLTGLKYVPKTVKGAPGDVAMVLEEEQGGVAAGNEPAHADGASDVVETAIARLVARADEMKKAGNLPAAERAMRVLIEFDRARFGATLGTELSLINPAWKTCPPGNLIADAPGDYVIEDAKNGEKTCAVKTATGSVQLHSKFEPTVEAKRLLGNNPVLAGGKSFVVLGLGLGYTVRELAEKIGPDARMFVVERRRQALEKFREMEWSAKLLADARLTFMVSVEPKVAALVLQRQCSGNVAVVEHAPSVQLDSAYYAAVKAGLAGGERRA